MRVGLVYYSLISNACLSIFVSCSQAYFVPGLRRLTSKRVPNLPSSVLKCFQLQGGFAPLTSWPLSSSQTARLFICPWTPLEASPPDPHYRLALPRSPYSYSVPVPFLLGNEHCAYRQFAGQAQLLMSRIEYQIPMSNIIVLDSHFNLTNKSNLIGKL